MKIPKRSVLVAGLAVAALAALQSSSGAAGKRPKAAAELAASQPADPMAQDGKSLVTFVELGSVNCVPCRMMQPVMAEIEKDYGKQVKVVFHDVWTPEGRPFGEQYRIRAIPTQVFLDRDGKEFFRHTGFFPKAEIVKVLKGQGVK